MELLFVALFCFSVTMMAYGVLDSIHKRRIIRGRLSNLEAGGAGVSLEDFEMARSFSDRVVMPFLTRAGSLMGSLAPESLVKRVSRRLTSSGMHRLTPRVYFGLKALSALAGATLILALAAAEKMAAGARAAEPVMKNGLFCAILFAGAGYFLPDVLLRFSASRRKKEIALALPDLLDLLTVSVEAGLGFGQALLHSAEKMKGAISDEIKRLLQDMRMGMKNSDAFRALSDRVMLPDLKTFCTALIQADQLGVSVAEVLRVQSESMRIKRRQRAEEAAMKAPLKLLFPLVFFVFPALFIILLGPAVINIVNNMKGIM